MQRQPECTQPEQGVLWPRERPRPEDRPLLACSDNLDFMRGLPGARFKLIVTSPPYNLGKEYESRTPLDAWLETQECVVGECAGRSRALRAAVLAAPPSRRICATRAYA